MRTSYTDRAGNAGEAFGRAEEAGVGDDLGVWVVANPTLDQDIGFGGLLAEELIPSRAGPPRGGRAVAVCLTANPLRTAKGLAANSHTQRP